MGGSHGHQKPTPRKAARSNSTKPLMASEDDDEMEEPTQEDWWVTLCLTLVVSMVLPMTKKVKGWGQ